MLHHHLYTILQFDESLPPSRLVHYTTATAAGAEIQTETRHICQELIIIHIFIPPLLIPCRWFSQSVSHQSLCQSLATTFHPRPRNSNYHPPTTRLSAELKSYYHHHQRILRLSIHGVLVLLLEKKNLRIWYYFQPLGAFLSFIPVSSPSASSSSSYSAYTFSPVTLVVNLNHPPQASMQTMIHVHLTLRLVSSHRLSISTEIVITPLSPPSHHPPRNTTNPALRVNAVRPRRVLWAASNLIVCTRMYREFAKGGAATEILLLLLSLKWWHRSS